jgi:cell division protein ZapA (FtsZ GTPase activity inhibitor)
MSTITKHTVIIGGESYTIVTDEPVEQLDKAVANLNDMMNALMQQTGKTDPKKLAVLCALDIILRMQKKEQRERDLAAVLDQEMQTPLSSG